MARAIEVVAYDRLRQKIFAIARGDHFLMGHFIPTDIGTYWLIGQELVWYAEDLLESLAFDVRKQYGKSWYVRELERMARLYLRFPTLEQLQEKCAERSAVGLDEVLDF